MNTQNDPELEVLRKKALEKIQLMELRQRALDKIGQGNSTTQDIKEPVPKNKEGLAALGLPALGNLIRGVGNTFAQGTNTLLKGGEGLSNLLLGTHLSTQLPYLPKEGDTESLGNTVAYGAGEALGTGLLGGLGALGVRSLLPKVAEMANATGIQGALTRALGGASLGALVSPENPLTGALLGGTLQPLGEGAGKALGVAFSPIKKGLSGLAASMSEKMHPISGLKQHLGSRTPQEAKELLENLPDNFITTLGSLTGNPVIKGVETTLEHMPFSGYKKQIVQGLKQTDLKANEILKALSGGVDPQNMRENVLENLRGYQNAIKEEMNKRYAPIENAAALSGFSLKERPNMQKVYEKYFDKESRLNKVGAQLKPDITQSELEDIQQKLNPPEGANFSEARNLESDLKEKAREYAAQQNYKKSAFYNELAAGLRKDYDSALKESIPEGLQAPLENANTFAKENYYNLFNDSIQDLLSGKKENILATLKRKENRDLLERLPEDLKHKLYVMELGNRVKGDQEISPAKLLSVFSRGSPESEELKETLLSPNVKKELKTLQTMYDLTEPARKILKDPGTTGKYLAPVVETAGSAELGRILAKYIGYPATLGLPVLTRKLSNRLTNPDVLRAYANLAKDNPSLFRQALEQLSHKGALLTPLLNDQGVSS